MQSGQEKNEAVLLSNFSENFFKVFRNEIEFEIPVKTKIVLGNILYDRLDFNDGVNFVISDRFLNILVENQLTGWKTYPVEIDWIDEKFHGFQITGSSGELIEPKVQGWYTGYKFDYDSWDGTDFFSPADTHLRFISEKAYRLLTNSRISNVQFQNILEIEAYAMGK